MTRKHTKYNIKDSEYPIDRMLIVLFYVTNERDNVILVNFKT